ncbi:MAG: phosphotransferase [Bacteroidales bacterium]|nr:phosphotransferase [Bacteroidales bacterium]
MELHRLYSAHYGTCPVSVDPVSASASNRRYYRMASPAGTCIGAVGTDRQENEAFVAISLHFRSKGIPVPEVFAVSEDGMSYLQEDLGDEVLLDRLVKARRTGEGLAEAEELMCSAMALLPKIQFEGASGFDFSVCYPQPAFDRRMVMFDLNYFKYCFLKATGLEFNEMRLQDDFEKLADDLLADDTDTFMYRDFNARNVMVRGGEPCFIDFQGGRRGPVYYDVASFVYHARAGYTDGQREKMLEAYLEALSEYMPVDRKVFFSRLKLFVLFRLLQVLGAYGFRGWTEHKAAFMTSIPAALDELVRLLEEPFEEYPYLVETLGRMAALDRFRRSERAGGLEVKVYSFSFKKGIPEDPSGNGGGYVFDCRSIHNPGRYEPYKKLTGRDEAVIRFLEDDGEILTFLDHVYGVVDPHVETFAGRGFTDLMVSFGCTGGQHRSVYCAEHLARHIAEKYPDVRVRLIHREQNIDTVL